MAAACIPERSQVPFALQRPGGRFDAALDAAMLDIGSEEGVPSGIDTVWLAGDQRCTPPDRRVLPDQPEIMQHQPEPPLIVLFAERRDIAPQGVRRFVAALRPVRTRGRSGACASPASHDCERNWAGFTVGMLRWNEARAALRTLDCVFEIWFWLGIPGIIAALAILLIGASRASASGAAPGTAGSVCGAWTAGGTRCEQPIADPVAGKCAVGHTVPKRNRER